MDFLSRILGPVVESLLVPVKKHLGYLLSSAKHVSNMTTRMKQLDGTSDDVKNHMETNNISNLEIPSHVPDWLEAVKKIKEDADRIISSNVNGCSNLKMRYRAGRNAFKTTREIEALIKENSETIWRDAQKALGKVSSKVASTSGPSDGDAQNDFKSREKIFKEALGLLQQDQQGKVIALCGMGGVGKTTMMDQLKKAVEDKKIFDYVVKVVIGQNANTFSIQQTVAEYIGHPLTETDKTARADRLRITFGKISQENKKKVLVILDDVWEMVELKDIGLCPLPNGSKLLLTSRNSDICKQIAVEANSDFKTVRVDVMEKLEANNFFSQITGVSKENDPELNDIGVEIVRRCGFLPLAIKLIARALNSQEKFVWRNTLHRLKENDLDENVQQIIEISYTFLKEYEVRAIFLLCGLFPDDFNIPIEDLTRYAWGLELLNKVHTLGDARDRTKTCVCILKDASLLIDSDHSEHVKMHDLVLAFVVAKVSKGDHPWIINHSDVSNWSRAEMSESCKRISLTCMGMSEFPRNFNYRNASLLRLMNGHISLKFPENFYEKMKNLQVIACEKLPYPLLPRSLQCSSKLQTLCLHQCSLMSDCSPIGDHLLNLEVLSFAHSGIRYLPSAIGNLVKLKLLDLTGCIDLRIDEGVLKNLARLEELYMTVAKKKYDEFKDIKGVRLTDRNCKELAERSKNLSALEVEFFENNPQSKNMSYKKLERFKISMGCFFKANKGKYMHSSENTLKFATNKYSVLESGMNELFSKTEVLDLEVGGMNNLEEVLPKSVPQHSLFYNLRVLRVYGCADLRYLFTVPVTSGLVKLERLTVSDCPVMEALVYNSENGQEGVDIRFQELKRLELYDLLMLEGLSNNTKDVIHLPQLVELFLWGLPNFTSIYPGEYKPPPPALAAATTTTTTTTTTTASSTSSVDKPFFNKQAMIPPRLEELYIRHMEALKNIWASPTCGSGEEVHATCLLREIDVRYCDNLVNMFPRNPMPFLHHLESIFVNLCSCLPKSVPRHSSFYNLRVLRVSGCADLRYLLTVPVASGLVKLEDLTVSECPVMETLVYNSESGEEGVDIRFQELKRLCLDELPKLEALSNNTKDVIHLPQLVELDLEGLPKITSIYLGEYKSAAAAGTSTSSDMSGSTSSSAIIDKPLFNKQAMIPPRLERLYIWFMEALKNIWASPACGSGEKVDATCCSLREIEVGFCPNLVNMFPRNPMPFLHHLETIYVQRCPSMDEVLFEIDDDDDVGCIGEIKYEGSCNLRSIHVGFSDKFREVWRLKGGGGSVNMNLFQAVERIYIDGCKRFRNIYTPTTARFDLRALTYFSIDGIRQDLGRYQQEEEEVSSK